MEWKAGTDPLTGLANSRRFDETFVSEMQRSRRNRRSFALVLLDLNGLKKINDTYGHLAGTQALRRVATVLRFHSRAVDTAARYGGDEFAVLLPETGADRALRVAQRIAQRVTEDDDLPRLSVSFGVAVYSHDGKTIEEVFQAADKRLYAMKRTNETGETETAERHPSTPRLAASSSHSGASSPAENCVNPTGTCDPLSMSPTAPAELGDTWVPPSALPG
jgi:diguanylate cyclase (GGDEF)-like protein